MLKYIYRAFFFQIILWSTEAMEECNSSQKAGGDDVLIQSDGALYRYLKGLCGIYLILRRSGNERLQIWKWIQRFSPNLLFSSIHTLKKNINYVTANLTLEEMLESTSTCRQESSFICCLCNCNICLDWKRLQTHRHFPHTEMSGRIALMLQ